MLTNQSTPFISKQKQTTALHQGWQWAFKEKQKHKSVKKETLEKEGVVDELEPTEAARLLKKLGLHLYSMVKKVVLRF